MPLAEWERAVLEGGGQVVKEAERGTVEPNK